MNDQEKTTSKRQIARLLGSSPFPVYLLSSDHTLVFANDALCHWLHRPLESLLGLHCSTQVSSSQDDNDDASLLLALPAAWSGLHSQAFVLDLSPFSMSPPQLDESAGQLPRWGRWLFAIDGYENGSTLGIIAPIGPDEADVIRAKQTMVHDFIVKHRVKYPDFGKLWYLHGNSSLIHRCHQQAQLAIASNDRLAIYGPLGSGRRDLAKIIHARRSQSNEAAQHATSMSHNSDLIQVDCSLMDPGLIQSVFGMIQENATANESRITVLIDGLELLPEACVPLLDQFVSAQENLRFMVTCTVPDTFGTAKGRFAVLARLSTLRVELPSLVERIDDIPHLVEAWADSMLDPSTRRRTLATDFMDALAAYSWPGDTQEFSETMQFAYRRCPEGEKLAAEHLPVGIRTFGSHVEHKFVSEAIDLDSVLADIEKTILVRALEKSGNNKSAAAKMLNISRARLIRRLQQLGATPSPLESADDADQPDFHEVD
jgi:DNA-binding protein Fis